MGADAVKLVREIHWIRGDGKTGCRLEIVYEALETPPSLGACTSEVFGEFLRRRQINDHKPCTACVEAFKKRAAELGLDQYGCPPAFGRHF
jgi:hypothetical protein